MKCRGALLVVSLVVFAAGCSSDEASLRDAPDASIVVDPDTGALGVEPLVETGTMQVTVVAADGTSPITVADRLDQLLSGYPGAKRASVDGTTVTAVVTDFPRDDAMTFEFTMQPEPVVALHPVISCADDAEDGAAGGEAAGDVPDVPADAIVLSGATVGECVLGPTPFERAPFVDAFMIQTLDIQVSVDVDPEQIDAFNALTLACYEATELCPSQRLAIVADGEILTAPTVNIEEFPTTLALTGDFTVESGAELARSIVDDRFTGEFVSAQYDYEADA